MKDVVLCQKAGVFYDAADEIAEYIVKNGQKENESKYNLDEWSVVITNTMFDGLYRNSKYCAPVKLNK